ncbi:hypothetical protein ElyMa_005336200 [Elysia marginata]|uniref:Uncharacterized protein n=1 Tax=Elysia marginata TaxID=1093978 RepID=A0AAV4E9P1_9GAST|nr:hypothetical protein ElyMa_005336200 [Elysia marginata]
MFYFSQAICKSLVPHNVTTSSLKPWSGTKIARYIQHWPGLRVCKTKCSSEGNQRPCGNDNGSQTFPLYRAVFEELSLTAKKSAKLFCVTCAPLGPASF